MNKIFHVFVSSTYIDLIDERKKVSEAVAKAGFVAEGMEIFPASSQRQMDFITRVIDRRDYYILIVAGRYGSEAEDGQSFTEKEFHYAQSKGIPVLAFIRNDLEKLPADQTEKEPQKQDKLEKFITALKADTMVDFWSSPDELAMKSIAALSQARVTHEGIGWIRGDSAAGADILNEINDLRKANAKLSAEVAAGKSSPIFDDINLADLDEEFEMQVKTETGPLRNKRTRRFTTSLTWRTILAAVGPDFRTVSNTGGLQAGLARAIRKSRGLAADVRVSVDMGDEERILMQMEALGVMKAKTLKLTKGGQGVFHHLTDKGLALMLRENVVRSSQETE